MDEKEKQDAPEETGGDAQQERQEVNPLQDVLDMLTQMREEQRRLAGEIAAVKDAQSVLVDAGAVIHDESKTDNDPTAVDGFVSIDALDLNL